jgi:hypothetical protein
MGIFRTAEHPSLEAAGKTSLFFTLRKMPIQSGFRRRFCTFMNNSGYRPL